MRSGRFVHSPELAARIEVLPSGRVRSSRQIGTSGMLLNATDVMFFALTNSAPVRSILTPSPCSTNTRSGNAASSFSVFDSPGCEPPGPLLGDEVSRSRHHARQDRSVHRRRANDRSLWAPCRVLVERFFRAGPLNRFQPRRQALGEIQLQLAHVRLARRTRDRQVQTGAVTRKLSVGAGHRGQLGGELQRLTVPELERRGHLRACAFAAGDRARHPQGVAVGRIDDEPRPVNCDI